MIAVECMSYRRRDHSPHDIAVAQHLHAKTGQRAALAGRRHCDKTVSQRGSGHAIRRSQAALMQISEGWLGSANCIGSLEEGHGLQESMMLSVSPEPPHLHKHDAVTVLCLQLSHPAASKHTSTGMDVF